MSLQEEILAYYYAKSRCHELSELDTYLPGEYADMCKVVDSLQDTIDTKLKNYILGGNR